MPTLSVTEVFQPFLEVTCQVLFKLKKIHSESLPQRREQ